MGARTLRLTVVKVDGTTEPYVHTKVVGTIANALNITGQPDIVAAEELSEAVTFYLYRENTRRKISSGEILSIIQIVLGNTGYEEAAIALSEYHFERRLRRCRVEVVKGQLDKLADAENLYGDDSEHMKSKWDKSRIIEDLVREHGLSRQTARTVASIVEERVFSMCLSVVPASLVKQLVLSDAAAIIRAQKQLQTA